MSNSLLGLLKKIVESDVPFVLSSSSVRYMLSHQEHWEYPKRKRHEEAFLTSLLLLSPPHSKLYSQVTVSLASESQEANSNERMRGVTRMGTIIS